MNGPIGMYKVEPIVKFDSPVELPHCMYSLRNIHEESSRRNGLVAQPPQSPSSTPRKADIFDQVKQFLKNNKNLPGMAELEARQEDILKQLAELRKQMDGIRTNLQATTNGHKTCPIKVDLKVKTHAKKQTNAPENLPNVIINVNPANPPYSLAIIQKLLDGFITISVTTHVHSSVTTLSEAANQLSKTLEDFSGKTAEPSLYLKLIWKNVSQNIELIACHMPILGEVNILRYLARITSPELNYELSPNPGEIDSLLDTIHCISLARTKTEKAALLQHLHKALGKGNWLAGRKQITVADIAAYSVLKQSCEPKEINVNLSKWLQRCETV